MSKKKIFKENFNKICNKKTENIYPNVIIVCDLQ